MQGFYHILLLYNAYYIWTFFAIILIHGYNGFGTSHFIDYLGI